MTTLFEQIEKVRQESVQSLGLPARLANATSDMSDAALGAAESMRKFGNVVEAMSKQFSDTAFRIPLLLWTRRPIFGTGHISRKRYRKMIRMWRKHGKVPSGIYAGKTIMRYPIYRR